MGCPHPGVEWLVTQTTELLIHYGCRSDLGLKMSVLMELLITELGTSSQPLCKFFSKYGSWVTHTWLQSLWEKVDKFDITVEIAPLPMDPPQEGEKWFMQAVVEAGFTLAQEMKSLNPFRCCWEVIYLLNVFDAGGRCLDRGYLDHQKQGEKRSTLIFPQENPPPGHLRLWRECLYSLAPRGRPTQGVGAFKSKGYNIWDWWYDEEASKSYHHRGHVMDIYTPSQVPGYTKRPNCWTRSQIGVHLEEEGEYCTVKQVSLGVYTFVSHTPRTQATMEPMAFWDMDKSWGNTWMWDNQKQLLTTPS
jgi:hypothetical protein